jgi:sugar/nucleoside kinase (ribokinase family)
LGIEQLVPDAIAQSEYLYIEGYLVTSPTGLAAAVRAREIADEAGVPVAVSFSDPGMVEHFPDQFRQIIGDGVDLVFANDAEAMGWTRSATLEGAVGGLKSVARQFAVTRGSQGAICFDGANLHEIEPHRVEAVDTNGAGDMFAGAFLYALTEGEDFPTAGRFAARAAGAVVAQWGPRLRDEQYGTLRNEFFGG